MLDINTQIVGIRTAGETNKLRIMDKLTKTGVVGKSRKMKRCNA